MRITGNNSWRMYAQFFADRKINVSAVFRRRDVLTLSVLQKTAAKKAPACKTVKSGQTLKSDEASLREREWRTNPDYRIPIRLYNSPEVTADRNAAIEKYRKGEELTEWENMVMYTFENGYEREKVLIPAEHERYARQTEDRIEAALKQTGIDLGDEELTFTVWGHELKISGNFDQNVLDELAENISFVGSRRIQQVYYNSHKGESEKGGLPLAHLQAAERYLKEWGGEADVFDLGVDGQGNITGLPPELDAYLKENAIGKFGESVPDKYLDRINVILKAKCVKESFRSAAEIIKNGGYEQLRSMTYTVKYKNGKLIC
ncbi:MAG: hypothetical protein NC120_10795 [Ruminococcus sp.]|nr:hypothetical protein [Ruminococcus sp.]